LIGAGGVATVLLISRLALRNLGATCEERRRALPGDDVVPDATAASTMATTIDAQPSAVWPWLVQMGCDRAGFYSWDRLDNGGRPSADEVHREWQTLEVGDRVASTPSGKMWFEVAELVPERALVLRASIDLRTSRPCDPRGPRPRLFTDGVWAFVLDELPGGRTRLIVRSRGITRPRPLGAQNLFFWDAAHVVMQTRQFRNLKRRAERTAAEPTPAAVA
jgi:hypothetical protein